MPARRLHHNTIFRPGAKYPARSVCRCRRHTECAGYDNRGRCHWLCLLLALLCTSRLVAQDVAARPDDAVVATIGDDSIHAGEVNRLLAKATGGKPATDAAQPFLQAQVLEEIISRCLVLSYARRSGAAASAAELAAALGELKAKLKSQHRTLEDFLKMRGITADDLQRQLAWNVVWTKYIARYASRERLDAYFQAHRRDLDGSRVSVSQILLRPAAGAAPAGTAALLAQAEQIRQEITAGKISFAAAAQKYSAGASREQGGRLGPLARHGVMDEAFSRAAFALEVGEVSVPVRTPFGVHLIRCDAIEPGTRQLADVRKEVEDGVARELMEKLAQVERRFVAVKYRGGFPHFQPGTHELAQ